MEEEVGGLCWPRCRDLTNTTTHTRLGYPELLLWSDQGWRGCEDKGQSLKSPSPIMANVRINNETESYENVPSIHVLVL